MHEIADGERPAWAVLTLAAFVGLVVCSYIGTAVATTWANTNPEGLLLLSSRVRHLLLVAGNINFWAYAVLASLRLGVAFVVCHLVGRAYGKTVLYWFGRYLGVPSEQIHTLFETFHKAEWFVIPFFVGSNIVAAISGISRTSARRMAVLLPLGLVVRVVFWWIVARIADDQVDSVLDFLAKYQRPALIASVVLTVGFVLFNLRRGRNFEL